MIVCVCMGGGGGLLVILLLSSMSLFMYDFFIFIFILFRVNNEVYSSLVKTRGMPLGNVTTNLTIYFIGIDPLDYYCPSLCMPT